MAKTIRKWHLTEKKHTVHKKNSGLANAAASTLYSMSHVHPLSNYQSKHDSVWMLPRMSYFNCEDPDSPFHHQNGMPWASARHKPTESWKRLVLMDSTQWASSRINSWEITRKQVLVEELSNQMGVHEDTPARYTIICTHLFF